MTAVDGMLPRYPIFIPSRGRAETSFTARCLVQDGVPFRIVVEAPEVEAYALKFSAENLLVLPFENQGLVAARNWIRDFAVSEGHVRHWQLDDNLRYFRRWYRGVRIECNSGFALACVEDFVDRYENVAIAGLNYEMFCVPANRRGKGMPPFYRNARVYSCTLFLNSIPHRWRGWYNDDTDICLQVLADGWCTVLMNAFMVTKIRTMKLKGGNTDHPGGSYQDDGRLKMSRELERSWPHVVKTSRKFQRPQHVIKGMGLGFDTPLRLKPGIDLDALPKVDERNFEIVQLKEIKHPDVQKLYDAAKNK